MSLLGTRVLRRDDADLLTLGGASDRRLVAHDISPATIGSRSVVVNPMSCSPQRLRSAIPDTSWGSAPDPSPSGELALAPPGCSARFTAAPASVAG